MGAGYHGGFGSTYGASRSGSFKVGYSGSVSRSYTKKEIVDFIDGITDESSAIAKGIRNGSIKVNILGDSLFESYLGADSTVVAEAVGNQIYLRNSSLSIYSDMVHEGKHASDYNKGIKEQDISSWAGETRAYSAERAFQIAAGLHVDFINEDDMMVHIWSHYKRR